jgi:hypothetical protein
MADRPAPSAEQIRSLWEALDKPGPEKLRIALQKRGFFAPSVQVLRDHFFKFQSSRQVFQRPPEYTGHAYSTGLDHRWMADIMVMPEGEHGEVLQIRSDRRRHPPRFAWGALLDSPMQADEGYRQILRRAGKAPSVLLTDGDPGFKTPGFTKALGETHHEIKVGQNDLSIVYRLIGFLKRKQKQAELDGQTESWADRLQERLSGWNHTGAPALYHSDPADLRGAHGEIANKELYFNRVWDESEGMQANAAAIERRAQHVRDAGAFRSLAPFPGPKRRIGDPVWSVRPHAVKSVDGPLVEDERGERFLTKEVLPIHKESTELAAPAPKLNAKARGMLQRYADRGRAFLLGQPERRANATRFYNALAAEGNVKEALRLAGVATDAVVKSVVRLFPETFRMETGKGGGAALVALLE